MPVDPEGERLAAELADRARYWRERLDAERDGNPAPGLRDEVDELRGEVSKLRTGLAAANEAAEADEAPARPALRLIQGEKAV